MKTLTWLCFRFAASSGADIRATLAVLRSARKHSDFSSDSSAVNQESVTIAAALCRLCTQTLASIA